MLDNIWGECLLTGGSPKLKREDLKFNDITEMNERGTIENRNRHEFDGRQEEVKAF